MKAQAASLAMQTEASDPRRPDDLIDRERMTVLIVTAHVAKDGEIPPSSVKNVEFVSRRPGMETKHFFDYWQDVHGPIARQIEYIRRYEQNHARPEYSPVRQPYDGLAITWFASTADMRAGTQTDAYQVTRADEPNFLPDGHLPIIVSREILDSRASA
ncbi:EthD domain-containing protein [Cupriavidus nantongensis]|nr:EthD domain-containing protein [Cupriavidus nantongensis]